MGSMICGYCGESTHIETINGKDACSYCGAGVDFIEKERDLSLYEEHAAVVIDTTVKVLEATAGIFEGEKNFERKAAEKIASNMRATQQIRDYPKNKRKGKDSNLGEFSYISAVIGIIFIFLLFSPGVFNMYGAALVDTPADKNSTDYLVSMRLYVDAIVVETGELYTENVMLEIWSDEGQMEYIFMFCGTALFDLMLSNGQLYEVWVYPYLNATKIVDAFMVIENETQLMQFPIY